MRRRIRLTGRKQLSKSCASLKLFDQSDKRFLSLSLKDTAVFGKLPQESKIKIRLYENKLVEIIDFGTLAKPKAYLELENNYFTSPSCQLRIVDTSEDRDGLLLASADLKLLGEDDADNDNSQGILPFMPSDLGDRAWDLEIRADDYPILRVNKKIPNCSAWAKNDPIFTSTVFPVVLERVFGEILENTSEPEESWMLDWLEWADRLMPGEKPPFSDNDHEEKKDWISKLISSFLHKHRLLPKLVGKLKLEEGMQ